MLVYDEVKSPSTKEPIMTIAKNNDVAKKITEEIRKFTQKKIILNQSMIKLKRFIQS